MSGRGGVRAGEGPKDTENMKMMSLLEKVEMLDKLDRWLRIRVVRRHYDVNELTLRFIKKGKDRIRGSTNASAASSEKISYVRRYDTFPKRWKDLLIMWLALNTRSNSGR
jgi:hypothetical protein